MDKARKLFDDRGLYLHITPKSQKYWRFKYRFDQKEKLLALGVYPDVTLKMARHKRDEARRLVAEGIDPGEHRKALKAAKLAKDQNSFYMIVLPPSITLTWKQKTNRA